MPASVLVLVDHNFLDVPGLTGKCAGCQGSGSWTTMNHLEGAQWDTASSPGSPFDLRITPNDGSAPLIATCVPPSLVHAL